MSDQLDPSEWGDVDADPELEEETPENDESATSEEIRSAQDREILPRAANINDERTRRGLRPVQFHLADGEAIFEGFADGSTWNGFDNVQVTPEWRARIVKFCRFDDPLGTIESAQCCEHPRTDHPERVDRYMTIKSADGLGRSVPILITPCTWTGCPCFEWNDGASGFTDIPVTPETNLVDLGSGYVTTLHDPATCEHGPEILNGAYSQDYVKRESAPDLCADPTVSEWVNEAGGRYEMERESARQKWHDAGHPMSLDEYFVEHLTDAGKEES